MPSAATVTSLIAIGACVMGAVVALGMWQQRRRAARARRLRHPATPPPVSIVIDEPSGRWRLEVAADAPPTAVDIVSWRPARSSAPWTSEPIVEPIELGPGGWALTPSEPPRAGAYDVSIAWTSHSDAGELQGSRTLRVDGRPRPRGGAVASTASTRSPLGWPFIEISLVAVLTIALIVVVVLRQSDGTSEVSDEPPAITAPDPTASTVPTRSSPPSTAVATTSVAAPEPTTPPPTTAPPTSSSSTSTTVPPTTTVPGPSITITASIDACQAGPNCLVASFVIDGFDTAPTTYVCEFADGDRIEFGFGGESVTRACATGSADASITIEIDGIRSDTVTRDDA